MFFPQLCISLMNVDVIPYNFSVCASDVLVCFEAKMVVRLQ